MRDPVARRLTLTAATVAGTIAWSAYQGRPLLHALHILQLAQYQTARFLQWSARHRERWTPPDRLAAGLGTVALASVDLLVSGRLTTHPAILAAWGGLGAWLWRTARP